jgi:hypothetical protein
MTGEGMVSVNGHSIYMHFTAIEGISKNNYQWPKDSEQSFLASINNRDCLVSIYSNAYTSMIEKCVLI